MSLAKQAKTLSREQAAAVLYLVTTRHPDRNRLIFLLSIRAGLRAKQKGISCRWQTRAHGDNRLADKVNRLNASTILPQFAWQEGSRRCSLKSYRNSAHQRHAWRVVRSDQAGVEAHNMSQADDRINQIKASIQELRAAIVEALGNGGATNKECADWREALMSREAELRQLEDRR